MTKRQRERAKRAAAVVITQGWPQTDNQGRFALWARWQAVHRWRGDPEPNDEAEGPS
jgi:hypothetical protein